MVIFEIVQKVEGLQNPFSHLHTAQPALICVPTDEALTLHVCAVVVFPPACAESNVCND